MGTVIGRNTHPLKIGTKLPTRDPGDLRPDATQVLGFTPSLNGIAHLGGFTADFTFSGHGLPRIGGILKDKLVVYRLCRRLQPQLGLPGRKPLDDNGLRTTEGFSVRV